MSTTTARTRKLVDRFAAARNKNRVLATALAEALTAAEARRRNRFAPPDFAASVRKVARLAVICDTRWATKTGYKDNPDGLVVDYHDPLRGFTTPWLIEQHSPYRECGPRHNTFSARQMDMSRPYDAQLIYNAYDGVAPIVKAAAAALAIRRGHRS